MRSLRRLVPVCISVVILAAVTFVDSSAATFSASGLGGELYGVSAPSSTNAWAVGNYYLSPSDIGDFKTVTEHRHGSTWSRVNSPSPPGYTAGLLGVSVVSPTDVWAVGEYNATSGNDRTLIEHWTGNAWKVVPSPNPSRFGNGLAAVSAASANDIWAVGYEGPPFTLALHWKGHSWTQVPSPNPGRGAGNTLAAVSALSSTNAWAVGYYVSGSGPKTLIERWNGSAWKTKAGVDPSGSDNELTGVSAVSPRDVWAVGYDTTGSGDETLVEHWDGKRWSRVPSPNVTHVSNLRAVSALSSTNVWAVGSSGTGPVKTLIEHWDGTRWAVVASPNLSSGENQLLGVSARSATDVWAVGYSGTNSGHTALVEHWDGTRWSVK